MVKFNVDCTVHGRFSLTVDAASKEEAHDKVQVMCDGEEFGLELESCDYLDFTIQQMYKVRRDGKELHTTYIRASDEVID